MNTDKMQPTNPQTTPDESAAALSFATMLSEGVMPKAPTDASQTLEIAPGGEEAPEMGNMPMEQETPAEEKSKTEEPEMEDHMKEMEDKMEKMVDEKMSKMEERMDKIIIEMMSRMKEKTSTEEVPSDQEKLI